MARHNELLVPQAQSAIDQLKWETTQELGLLDKVQQVGWGNMTTREVGTIGGHMVKKMISAAEASLAQGTPALQQSERENKLQPERMLTEPTGAYVRFPENTISVPQH